ncbi:MAG: histidine triad nucleotide-binding protein [Clostridia bacterium]
MNDCIFCKIVAGEIPSSKVYEDNDILAFNDISPMAKVHVLIIPKKHIMDSSADTTEENAEIIAKIFVVCAKLAKELGLKDGFRIVTNSKQHGCQSVDHLHFHLLGGEQLSPEMA